MNASGYIFTSGHANIGDTVYWKNIPVKFVDVVLEIGNSYSIKIEGISQSVPTYVSPNTISIFQADNIPEIPATEELVKPQRYNKGKIEVWDFILDQGLGFLAGNIVKYLCRSDMKGGLADLKKARIYLDKLIAEEEKK